jgi:hypothetical protein
MTDSIRDAIQRYLLDTAGDGWSVTQFVIVMGLEKINSDGALESTAWHWSPKDQPHWQTCGLLDYALDTLSSVTADEDDCD